MLPKKSIEQGREREETADHFFCSLSFILDETLKREREGGRKRRREYAHEKKTNDDGKKEYAIFLFDSPVFSPCEFLS